jgi:hypothetical protein
MKKLTLFTALSLSLFMLASCGKDKKKKNNDISVSGIIQGNCQPQVTSGQMLPQDVQQQVMQSCQQQLQSNPALNQKRMTGQPLYFTVTYTQGAYNPYQAQQMQGQYPYQQNPYQQNPYMQNPYMQNPYMMNPYQQQPQFNGNTYTMNGLSAGGNVITGLSIY